MTGQPYSSETGQRIARIRPHRRDTSDNHRTAGVFQQGAQPRSILVGENFEPAAQTAKWR